MSVKASSFLSYSVYSVLINSHLALKYLPPSTEPGRGDIPWHRVLSSTGHVSSRGPGTSGAQIQREALEAEGIVFRESREGEGKIDWTVYGWFPASVELDGADVEAGPSEGNNSDEDNNGAQE